jgi:hypothetical protein
MNVRLALLCGAGAALWTGQASAATQTYSDLGAFLAAAPNATRVETFTGRDGSGANAPGQVINATGFNGFAITGNRNRDYFGISHGGTVGNIDGTHFLNWSGIDSHTGPTFTLVFEAPVTAFAFDFNDRDGSDRYGITLSTGELFDAPPFAVFTGAGFFGVRSDTAFTSVTFALANAPGGILESFGIDNVRTNAGIAPVPEPASWAMMIGGLGLAGAAARRRAATAALA